MLGGVALAGDDGVEVDALLRQPKHVALLAYLALPRPGAWHRRDTLLATFWPELDDARARTALRSALHTLRRHLAPATVRNRGNDEVGVAPEALDTDVGHMRDAAADGRHAEALAWYRGDLLPGLHVDAVGDFQRWLDQERQRLRALARQSASALARDREQGGDVAGAIDAARRAAELALDDEGVARALIALLDRAGDRAQAFAAYERLRTHLGAEFGTRPSAETLALVEAVRTRRASVALAGAPPAGEPPADESLAEGAGPDEPVPLRATAPTPAAPPVDSSRITPKRPLPASAPDALPAAGSAGPPRFRRRYALWGVVAAAVVAVLAAVLTPSAGSRAALGAPPATPAVPRLLVLPPKNATGDTAEAYLGTGISDGVARQLAQLGTLTVRSSAYARWPAAAQPDLGALGRKLGSTILLRLTLARAAGVAGDSLEVQPVLLDSASHTEHPLAPTRFIPADARDVASAVAAAVVGATFRVPEPLMPHRPTRAVDPESYRLTLDGWHQFFSTGGNARSIRARFQAAIARDPLNARAWAGVATTWGFQLATDQVPADEAYENAVAAAERALALDSSEGNAWAVLAHAHMARARSFAAGAPFLRRGITADPSNPEVYIWSAEMYREVHRWDDMRAEVRRARALDPLNPDYLDQAAWSELCANRPAAALTLTDEGLRADMTHLDFWRWEITALGRLGRYDEALAAWRRAPARLLPPPVRAALGGARGAAGFWSAWRAQGRARLAGLRAAGARGYASPELVASAMVQAGDTAAGWRALNARVPARALTLYKLPCISEFDEVRGTPQYATLLARVGPMPER
ncbi:hypothetical protein tb265_44080 [Gemmatimonadetes bacterium T265]|nr:hypothetical protein tb265_44080 [Gemmatimonadetes bacterium T265]